MANCSKRLLACGSTRRGHACESITAVASCQKEDGAHHSSVSIPATARKLLELNTTIMFSLPKISVPSFLRLGGGSHLKVDLPSVQVHDIETAAEKRPRTLKHLLKANHANYSIIYHDLRFHNHAPHVCCSNAMSPVAG
jgi:hypothetical protein